MKSLAARKLGLVFKEASAKKINPQHEYHFFHKTFQEYLAALYLAHKLLEEKVNVFHDLKLSFDDITRKYNQVFIFVSGIPGEATCNLFRQIGENLKVECWNWLNCSEQEATFFTECFSESGEAEQMATTLCSFIPFPQSVIIQFDNSLEGVLRVANVCKSFSQLQLPVHLTVYFADNQLGLHSVHEFLASYSRIETIVFSVFSVQENPTGLVCSALQVNPSLHSFTLQTNCRFSSEEAAAIGDNLAANKTLQTVTLKLLGEFGDHWAIVLEKGLSGDTPLTSVVLEINGSVRESDTVALNNLLLNRSLQSFRFTIYGDMQDSLATSVAKGLAADSNLKSLTLIVHGTVSCSAFISLKKGVLENGALKSLVLKVFGGIPENWINICEALYAAKKSSLSLIIEPDLVSKITSSQMACLRPVLLEEKFGVLKLHSLTVKIWGELTYTGASDLCKLLIASRVSCVTNNTTKLNLNIHGRVTDGGATCLVENFDKVKSLFDLSINIRREVTRDGNSTLQALTRNPKFSLTSNVHEVKTDDEISEEIKLSGVDSSSLSSEFSKVESVCSRVRKMIMNCDSPMYLSEEDWGCSLGDFLAKFVSLASLCFSLNNHNGISEGWLGGLWSGLAQNTSITTLSITINNYNDMVEHWMGKMGRGLAQNTSITALTITVNNYSEMRRDWIDKMGSDLAKNTSITMLSITVNNYSAMNGHWMDRLERGLAENTSITTLSITVNDYTDMRGEWISVLGSCLAENTSITTLSITAKNYSDISGEQMGELGAFLSQGKSITTLSITVNNYGDMSRDWMDDLGLNLKGSTSITTLSITVNNYSYMCGSWMNALGSCVENNTSITTLSITVNNYSCMSKNWRYTLWRGVAGNKSITTLTIAVNNHSDMSEDWMDGLSSCVARNTSMTTLSIAINNHSDMRGNWINKLCQALSRNTSSIKIFLEVNVFSESNENP